MERNNKQYIMISYVAYMGAPRNITGLSQHFFGNIYFSLEDYNKESNWENLKQIMARNINEANRTTPGDIYYIYGENIVILNVLEN